MMDDNQKHQGQSDTSDTDMEPKGSAGGEAVEDTDTGLDDDTAEG